MTKADKFGLNDADDDADPQLISVLAQVPKHLSTYDTELGLRSKENYSRTHHTERVVSPYTACITVHSLRKENREDRNHMLHVISHTK